MSDQLETREPEIPAEPTPDKAAIARANGAKSQGPATARGKAASSRNALRHGLAARQVVLPNESESAFRSLRRDFHDRFQPANSVEAELVDAMVLARWRLRRLPSLESTLVSNEIADRAEQIARSLPQAGPDRLTTWIFKRMSDQSRSLPLLLRYETTLTRAYDQAFRQFRELRDLRPATPPPAPIPVTPPALCENPERTQFLPSEDHPKAA